MSKSFTSAVWRSLQRRYGTNSGSAEQDRDSNEAEVQRVEPLHEHGNVFYSQFGEDAVLRGYFRRRHERRKMDGTVAVEPGPIGTGYYVDVGCYHPTRYSNTYHFYLQGWRGLNIDPTPGTRELFDSHRPGDKTIEVAVSDEAGELTFYGPGGRSVFNTLSKEQADQYVEAGWFDNYTESTVSVRPLADLLDEHLPPGQQIDLLDIDVEGFDVQVLRSNDWTRYRPEIVLVECHSTRFHDIIDDDRSRILLGEGYEILAWVPPNVFFRAT